MKRSLILIAIFLMALGCDRKPSKGDIFNVEGDLYFNQPVDAFLWTVYDEKSRVAFTITNPPQEAEDPHDHFRVKMRLRVLSAGPSDSGKWLAEIVSIDSVIRVGPKTGK